MLTFNYNVINALINGDIICIYVFYIFIVYTICYIINLLDITVRLNIINLFR